MDHLEQVYRPDLDTRSVIHVSPAYETIWGRTRQRIYDDPPTLVASIHAEGPRTNGQRPPPRPGRRVPPAFPPERGPQDLAASVYDLVIHGLRSSDADGALPPKRNS